MASPKIKMDLNIPLLGTIKYCDYYDAKPNPNEPEKMMSAQWGLKGSFVRLNPDGTRDLLDGVVYLDTFQLSADPVQLGLAAPNGLRDGKPQYKWLHAGQIQLVKREDGRKRIIQIARVGEAPAAQTPVYKTVADDPRPPFPGRVTVVEQLTPPPPALRVAQARSEPAVAAACAGERRAGAGQNPADYAAHDEWAALEARYARCAEIAWRIWGDETGEQAIVAATATLLIQAEKEHLPTPTRAPDLVAAPKAPGAPDTSGPPRPEQIAQFRALLGTDDPYGGGPIFETSERQQLMAAHVTNATAHALDAAMQRMQKTIAIRTSKTPQPASRTAGGPGMPGAGVEQMPEALEDGEDSSLPF